MKVYIVRHGQTEWNKSGKWQGIKDIPLDAEGIAQAGRIAERLFRCGIGRIYSSPLARAAKTAEIISRSVNAEIILNDYMKEIDIGQWTGLTLSEMESRYREPYTQWDSDGSPQNGYGVEGFLGLQERSFTALKEICSKEDGDILLVAHGTWLRALICKLLSIPLRRRNSFEIDNAGITVLDYNKAMGVFKVVTLNALL